MKLRTPATYLAAVSISALAILGIVQCGGSGSTAAAPVVITGSVLAPGGSLAMLQRKSLPATLLAGLISSADAQSSTLDPVTGTNVLVFAVDSTGTPTGNVIASTTTDGSGNYQLTLPAGTSLSSSLVVQASSTTTPTAVCNNTGGSGCGTQQNCPATQNTVVLTPATEYATRALIAYITANAGSTLSNFTPSEINAIIGQVVTAAQDPSLVGATIQDTINNIVGVVDNQTQVLIADAADPGEASAPTGLGGTYNLVEFDSEAFPQIRQESGTATIDVSAKTFSVSANQSQVELNETCGVNGPCDVTFAANHTSKADSTSGSITLLGGNQIAFQPSGQGENGALGSYSSTGDIVVIPSDNGLIVLVKQTSSAPVLSGDFQAVGFDISLHDASGSTYSLADVSNSAAQVTVSGGNFTGNDQNTSMTKSFTCSDTGNGTCSMAETLSQSSSSGAIDGTVSAASTGVMTLTPTGQSAHTGAINASKTLFAFLDGDPASTDHNGGMVLGLSKPTTTMSITDIAGDYNFAQFGIEMDTGSSNVQSEGGSVTVGTDNSISFNAVGRRAALTTSCASCPSNATSFSSKNESGTGTIEVTSTGGITLTAGDTLTGYASADGKIIALTQAKDGTGSSSRSILLFVR